MCFDNIISWDYQFRYRMASPEDKKQLLDDIENLIIAVRSKNYQNVADYTEKVSNGVSTAYSNNTPIREGRIDNNSKSRDVTRKSLLFDISSKQTNISSNNVSRIPKENPPRNKIDTLPIRNAFAHIFDKYVRTYGHILAKFILLLLSPPPSVLSSSFSRSTRLCICIPQQLISSHLDEAIFLIISPIIPAPVANTVSQNVSVKSIIILP